MEKLTRQEEGAMQAVWRTGEGAIKQVMENLPASGIPYTTVASTLRNLERKGYLSSRMIGKTYLYKPLIGEGEYKRKLMSRLVRDYFHDSYKEVVNFLVEEAKLGAKELIEIIERIERK